jgi:hypothetical protein
MSMTQGSNHPRTARSALGQDIGGEPAFSSADFFPLLPWSERELLKLGGLPA